MHLQTKSEGKILRKATQTTVKSQKMTGRIRPAFLLTFRRKRWVRIALLLCLCYSTTLFQVCQGFFRFFPILFQKSALNELFAFR